MNVGYTYSWADIVTEMHRIYDGFGRVGPGKWELFSKIPPFRILKITGVKSFKQAWDLVLGPEKGT